MIDKEKAVKTIAEITNHYEDLVDGALFNETLLTPKEAIQAIEVYSRQHQAEGMRWVKASEKLPPMEKCVYLKINGSMMELGNFYEQDQAYFIFIQRNSAHEEYENPYHIGLTIEWLDESPFPAQSAEKEVSQEEIENMLKICSKILFYRDMLSDMPDSPGFKEDEQNTLKELKSKFTITPKQ